ncbi:MAG TPA: DUF1993 domain-containing protein [Nevskiaceae bacterium]|nr:DUF1993 domain-containing protein [Nevskiaceae bacterium]
MSLSMYESSIPVLIQALSNLRAVLGKGSAHAEARQFDPLNLTQSRLFPDMLPLTSQVQIACDMAKGCGARLAGIEAPKFEDGEKTFGELQGRIDKTLAFLGGLTPAQIDGAEGRAIELKTPRLTLRLSGRDYLFKFVLPNVYFHCTTAYNLLRQGGVEIGKLDYLGPLQ